MSTAGEIWEVMAEEISGRPADRGREIRLTSGYVRYGTADTESTLLAAEIDPDDGVSGDAAFAFACKHYDVTADDVQNTQIRRTAVIAARVSIATRLANAAWSLGRIARLLHTSRSNIRVLIRGGEGRGLHVRSRVAKALSARRPRHRPAVYIAPRVPQRSSGTMTQAVDTLRRLRACRSEHLFPRVVRLYFMKLDIDAVYEQAFGRTAVSVITLDQARAAEARGEGVIRFVNGVPQWIPNESPRDPNEPRAAL